MYYWNEFDRYPTDKEIIDNVLVSKNGIVGEASAAYQSAISDYVLVIASLKSGATLSPDMFEYSGRNAKDDEFRFEEGVDLESYAKMTGSPSAVYISALEWQFINKNAKSTVVKVPGVLVDDAWYDVPVRMYDAMTGEEYTEDKPLMIDIGEYALVRLEQDVKIGEPLVNYVIFIDSTASTLEYTLLNGEGIGDTRDIEKEEEVVEEEPEEEPVKEEPVILATPTNEEVEVVEEPETFPVKFVIGIVISVLAVSGVVISIILTGIWRIPVSLIMEAKYRYIKIKFHGVISDKKHWAIKTTPHAKNEAPNTMILRSNGDLHEAVEEILHSKVITYFPISTGMKIIYKGKALKDIKTGQILIEKDRADEDEIYAFLEKAGAAGIKIKDLEIHLINEKVGFDVVI